MDRKRKYKDFIKSRIITMHEFKTRRGQRISLIEHAIILKLRKKEITNNWR